MITFIEAFKRELEDEAKETRRMLKQVPMGKYDWQPHPKSMKMGILAIHLAEIPDMITKAIVSDKWDFAEEEWNPKTFENQEELLAVFDNSYNKAIEALNSSSDSTLQDNWKLCAGDITYLEMERWEAVRHAFGQNAHHRAQLQVYLRLQDIPVPGPYGPSADETEKLVD